MKFYKEFEKHRPDEMKKPEAPLYLAVKQKRSADDQIWYMRSPLGKSQLGKFFVGRGFCCWPSIRKNKAVVRKTSIGRLLDANFPENYVMQLGGHKNIQSLSANKSASLSHQRLMSDVLSRRNQPATSSCTHINLDDSVKVRSASNIQNAVTSVSSSYPSTSNALEAIFAGANISSVSDCTFQIMTGPVNIVSQPALKRPRRPIIESDDED